MREWDPYSLILEDATLGQFARAVASLPANEAGAVLERAWAFAGSRTNCANADRDKRRTLEWFLAARHDINEQRLLPVPESWNASNKAGALAIWEGAGAAASLNGTAQ